MKLDIVLWPDPVLLAGTEVITEVDDDLRAVVGEMRRVLFEERGVGLAAPQVGIAKRLMLVCPSGQPGDEFVVINPEIVAMDGEEIGEEGCLSFPGIFGKVPRAVRITVRYQDLDGKHHEENMEGLLATCIQHEMDHLEGILFIDHLSRLKRQMALKKLKKLRQAA